MYCICLCRSSPVIHIVGIPHVYFVLVQFTHYPPYCAKIKFLFKNYHKVGNYVWHIFALGIIDPLVFHFFAVDSSANHLLVSFLKISGGHVSCAKIWTVTAKSNNEKMCGAQSKFMSMFWIFAAGYCTFICVTQQIYFFEVGFRFYMYFVYQL